MYMLLFTEIQQNRHTLGDIPTLLVLDLDALNIIQLIKSLLTNHLA